MISSVAFPELGIARGATLFGNVTLSSSCGGAMGGVSAALASNGVSWSGSVATVSVAVPAGEAVAGMSVCQVVTLFYVTNSVMLFLVYHCQGL